MRKVLAAIKVVDASHGNMALGPDREWSEVHFLVRRHKGGCRSDKLAAAIKLVAVTENGG